MEVKLSDIKIKPIISSVKRLKISDEEYFSEKYKDYISNSRLRYINPDQGGSPSMYKNGIPKETTHSLMVGSAVHELLLQPESFSLAEDLKKPTAKLGDVCDNIIKNRKEGKTIYDSIIDACKTVNYYVASLNEKRIKTIINNGLHYYIHAKNIDTEKNIILSSKDRDNCERCLKSLTSNKGVMRLLHPTDDFDTPIPSYNEDAVFIDVKCTYKNKNIILKLKMKADNWTIDEENKKIVLNDLKTTGRPISYFMQEYGSFVHYHYNRQMAMYLWMLFYFCRKKYKADKSWNLSSNILVIETVLNNASGVYHVSRNQLRSGKAEFLKLLKMVAYCEMFGYNDDLIFS